MLPLVISLGTTIGHLASIFQHLAESAASSPFCHCSDPELHL
ncbi:hypothetical protein OH686_07565 [Pseudomonas sp. SO81]|nr:hypothetical protein OH686_07565 [Pseudomonas sp. SO81]